MLSRDPDGGWGWVIVATSFVISTVHVGAVLSFSAVIYTDLIEAYDVSTWLAGMVTMAASVGINIAGKTLTPLSTPLLSSTYARCGLAANGRRDSEINCTSMFVTTVLYPILPPFPSTFCLSFFLPCSH